MVWSEWLANPHVLRDNLRRFDRLNTIPKTASECGFKNVSETGNKGVNVAPPPVSLNKREREILYFVLSRCLDDRDITVEEFIELDNLRDKFKEGENNG